MAVSGVFVLAIWIILFSTEGFTVGSAFFAFVILMIAAGFAFISSLTVNCWIDEDGVHRNESTVSWEGVASATINKGLMTVLIHSPEANSKGWIALPSPWFVPNRGEIASWIKSTRGSSNRLHAIFAQESE